MLPIMPLTENTARLAILGMLDSSLFAFADKAVAAGARFATVHMRLTAFQAGYFTVGQGTILDARFNSFLLIDITLNIGLHAPARDGIRISGLGVMLFSVDVAAYLVLHVADTALLSIGQFAVFQRIRFSLADAGLFTLQLGCFARGQLAGLQALLDTLLLINVALHFACGGLRKDGHSQKRG